MSRCHVCTYHRESCVNREACATEDEARRLRHQRAEEQDRANLHLRQQRAAALRASVLEDADDSVPAAAPFQYAYRFTVEPCTEGERCLACLEAGLI